MATAGMNPLGPTFRAETQHGTTADPTVPPLPEEEGEVTAEPEDPPKELLSCWLEVVSRTYRESSS